jgi:hypothetical protein
MTESLVHKADSEELGKFFRLDLFWSAPDHKPIQIGLEDGLKVTATNVSSYKGVRVWEVPVLPGSAAEAQLDHVIAKNSTNRLIIFRDSDRQVWRWPSRSTKGGGVISRPARHVHQVGTPDPQFEAKLDAIRLPHDVQVDVNELLARVRGAFDVETKNETKRASKLMAQMYAAVEKGYAPGVDPKKRDHEISVTLARILFLLFGDDTEMWKSTNDEPISDLFRDFIKDHTERDGSDIAQRLNALCRVLNTEPAARKGLAAELEAFPYVNGGIFAEKITLPTLDGDLRKAILDASAVDWSTISPAIFGSMFQSVRDAQTRRELGEHYTSEENILKTLNPLFLDELRAQFDAALQRDTKRKKINALNTLWRELGEIRYIDPACGCGNFIIVAFRELRDLELRIMGALQDLSGVAQLAFDPTLSLTVTLDHFYGIEIDEWPARIAETAMFLIDRQSDLKMKERFGVAPERLPIQQQATIRVGNALRLDWSEICPPSGSVVVAGNPPFVGARLKSAAQAEDLKLAWGTAYDGDMDLVTGWHAKALSYFGSIDGRWAFVATSSICQGAAPAALFGPISRAGWTIKFAHRTFGWTSEASGAAAVHCVIVGFARGLMRPRLFDYPTPSSPPVELDVSQINAYLVDAPWVLVQKRREVLSPALTKCDYGSMANDGGHLLVDRQAYHRLAADPVASRYLRQFKGADELVKGKERWCLWLEGASARELKSSPLLRERVEAVRKLRSESKRAATQRLATSPHLFGERRQPDAPYLCIPRHVSEDRQYFTVDRYEPEVICGDANFAAADPSGLLFSVMSSAMFKVWLSTIGGRLESRLRFSSTVVWNNFPMPLLAQAQRDAIIHGGEQVLAARATQGGKALSDLYRPGAMAADLFQAHAALDQTVDHAFGLTSGPPTTEERQQALFIEYAKLGGGLVLAPVAAPRTSRRRLEQV